MPLHRPFVLAIALVVATACSRSASNDTAVKSESPVARTASANGTLDSLPGGSASTVRDSISDRADRGRISGDGNAKVWVIMLSDFQCPYCKQWHDAYFAPIMRDYVGKNKVQIAFINFPLSIHPNAMPAAEAAMCASVQNKFWPAHDALFASQEQWAAMPDPAAKFAQVIGAIPGIDAARWRTCYTQHQTAALVQADRERARNAGAQSTPTFIVDGQMLAGADKNLRAEIDAALAKKR